MSDNEDRCPKCGGKIVGSTPTCVACGWQLTEGQIGECAHCRKPIRWLFDLNEDEVPTPPYGFWYDKELGTEVCGGPDLTVALDDDLWHELRSGVHEEA